MNGRRGRGVFNSKEAKNTRRINALVRREAELEVWQSQLKDTDKLSLVEQKINTAQADIVNLKAKIRK